MDCCTEKKIHYYKKYLDEEKMSATNTNQIMDALRGLDMLSNAIKSSEEIEGLRNTGIVKTVKRYRKYEGELGEMARDLASKWKKKISSSKREKKAIKDRVKEAEDQGGLSFEDFLTYDVKEIEAKKSAKAATKIENNRPESSSHRATLKRDHGDQQQSSHSKPEEKENVSSKKRKAFDDVPLPPTKHVMVSADDIDEMISSLSDDSSANYQPVLRQKLLVEPVTACVESDAGVKSKTRTPVYSGRRKTPNQTAAATPQTPSLAFLEENIGSLGREGGVPFEIVKPVLQSVSPKKLYTLEKTNPLIIDKTDELWMRHCGKDFRGATPQEFESWRELYWKKHDERENRLKSLTAAISKGVNRQKDAEKKTKLAIFDAKVPRDGVVRNQSAVASQATGSKSSSGNTSATPRPSGSNKQRASKKTVKQVTPLMAKVVRSYKGMRRY